jgi:ABC-type proline/glycine betaine transport system permease subunit
MVGCTRRQMVWKVMVPSAMQSLMVGINQVIMLSLNMVIIASMIGAGGLGYEVLTALRRLDIGTGVEAGFAIVALAVALDRLSQALARRSTSPLHAQQAEASVLSRHPYTFAAVAMVILTGLLGLVLPALQTFPEAWRLTTGDFWNEVVKWINVNYFDQLEAVKNALLLNVMIPFKRFLTSLPWAGVVALVTLAGWSLGGWRLALLTVRFGIPHRGNGPMGKGDGHRLPVRYQRRAGLPDRHSDRHVHRFQQAAVGLGRGGHRHAANPAVVRLSDAGSDAVPGRRFHRHAGCRGLRGVAGHPVYGPWPATSARQPDRGRPGQWLHRMAADDQDPPETGAARDHARHQPDCHAGPVDAGHHRAGRHAGPGTGGLHCLTKADTGRGLVAGLAVAFIAIIADRLITAGSLRLRARLGLSAQEATA